MATAMLLPSTSHYKALTTLFLNKNGKLRPINYLRRRSSDSKIIRLRDKAIRAKTQEIETPPSSSSSAEEITEKFGLEAGLWKVYLHMADTNLSHSFLNFGFSVEGLYS